MPIVTLDEYKTYAGVSGSGHDARLTDILAHAQAWLERRCGRTFDLATHDDAYDGGGETIFLRNAPVASVTEVRIVSGASSSVVDPDSYRIDAVGGRLIRISSIETVLGAWTIGEPSWPRGTMNILVTYTAGYTVSTAPHDLKRVIFRVADGMFAEGRTDPAASSESIGAYSRTMRSASDASDAIERLILPYRRNVA